MVIILSVYTLFFSLNEKYLEDIDCPLMSHMTQHRPGTEKLLQNGWLNSLLSFPVLGSWEWWVLAQRVQGVRTTLRWVHCQYHNTLTSRRKHGVTSHTTLILSQICFSYVLKNSLSSYLFSGSRWLTWSLGLLALALPAGLRAALLSYSIPTQSKCSKLPCLGCFQTRNQVHFGLLLPLCPPF